MAESFAELADRLDRIVARALPRLIAIGEEEASRARAASTA